VVTPATVETPTGRPVGVEVLTTPDAATVEAASAEATLAAGAATTFCTALMTVGAGAVDATAIGCTAWTTCTVCVGATLAAVVVTPPPAPAAACACACATTHTLHPHTPDCLQHAAQGVTSCWKTVHWISEYKGYQRYMKRISR